MEKGLELSPSPPNFPEDFRKIFPLLISINWLSLVGYWVVGQKIYSKMHSISCIDTHRDVADLVNHEMVKNTKLWISWEQKITFLQNKKILRSYHFLVEVTFNKHVPQNNCLNKIWDNQHCNSFNSAGSYTSYINHSCK